MTWIEDIGAYLQTSGVGTLGTNIFYSDFSPGSQDCIAIIAQPGRPQKNTASGDMKLQRPELGVRVRNTSDDTALEKAVSICNLLNLKVNTTIGSTRFKRIEAISEPFFIGQSKNKSFIYSVNFEINIG